MNRMKAFGWAAGVAMAASVCAVSAMAEPETKPTTQPADAAKPGLTDEQKKALEQALKQAQESAGKMGDATATMMNPMAQQKKETPVPSDLPVIEKKELEGGLIVEELKIGTGYEVKADGIVVAHYHGTLKADPTKVFDSSFQRGEPVPFPLSGVIAGWQKGVPGMKVGGIRRLTIPAALGYGERGMGADIPPNSDLVFIIQLEDAMQIEDVTVGTGEVVGTRPICVTAFTMKTADGKEVDSATKESPFIWVPGEHNGMQWALEGMKVGGKRKVVMPAAMNQTASAAPNPKNRPNNVGVTVEVELIAIKNLVPPMKR